MRKSLSLVVLLVAIMVLASGCTLFAPKNVTTSIKLTLNDGTPLSGIEVKILKDAKEVETGKSDQNGLFGFVLKKGTYKVKASVPRDVGDLVTIEQSIKVQEDNKVFEIPVANTGLLRISVKDCQDTLIPNSKVKLSDSSGKLIKEFDATDGTVQLLVEAVKTYQVEAIYEENTTEEAKSVEVLEKTQDLVCSILVHTFEAEVTTNKGIPIPGMNVKIGSLSQETDVNGKIVLPLTISTSDVVLSFGEFERTFSNVDLTKPQEFKLNVGLVDTVLKATEIVFVADKDEITLIPNESREVKALIPNKTYDVSIELPYYSHLKEAVVVDGEVIKLGRTFETIDDFGTIQAGSFTAENGVFKPITSPGSSKYAVLSSKDEYEDAVFYVEAYAPGNRYMVQMRCQMNTAVLWTSSYSFDVTVPQANFIALRKYPGTSSPNPDLKSREENPTDYQAGDRVAIVTKAIGNKFSVDLFKQEDRSKLWHEEFEDDEFTSGTILICSWVVEDKEISEFTNPTVLF